MRHSLLSLIFLFAIGAAPLCRAADDKNSPPTRDKAVIDTFQIMCNFEPLNFDHLDQKATAMQLHVLSNSKAPSPGNTVTRSKSWAGADSTTGPYALLLDEMSGAKGKSTGCAIVGDVPDADAFRTSAVKMMKLPAVPQPEMRGDGSRSYIWDSYVGPGTTLILRDFKPSGKPGVMLKLLVMERAR